MGVSGSGPIYVVACTSGTQRRACSINLHPGGAFTLFICAGYGMTRVQLGIVFLTVK